MQQPLFATRAGKIPISILPRLRSNQLMQLGPALQLILDENSDN